MEKRIIINNKETPYWIDDTGRVRNEKTNTWLKGAINKGYRLISPYLQGKQYTLYIHRLVAEYFLDNPNNLPIVHHKDGNKLNNCVWNLEWVSSEEHGERHGQGANLVYRQCIQDEEIDINELRQFRASPYYVSKNGDVYNLNKKIKMRFEQSGNYYRVQCNYNLRGKHFQVHRMVWESFNGEIPEGMEINHINHDPHDNRLENLELTSHKENCTKARHNNIEVYSINPNTNERIDYSSVNQAAIAVLGYRDGRKIPQAIANNELFKGCYWYYKE